MSFREKTETERDALYVDVLVRESLVSLYVMNEYLVFVTSVCMLV